MLKTLLILRLRETLARFTAVGGDKSKRPGPVKLLLIGLLWAYVFGASMFIFFSVFKALAPILRGADRDWFFFAFLIVLSFAMMFVLSVFTAKAQLFEARDNELLFSLPIPPGTILASRMTSLLLTNFGLELLVALPAFAAWLLSGPVTGGCVLGFVLLLVCLPMFSTALSAFFGWLLALVSLRVRRKTLTTTLLSLAFLCAYFYVYSNINSLLATVLSRLDNIADSLSSVLPLYWLAKGVAGEAPWLLLAGIACLALPFVLCCAVLSRNFIKTATDRRGFAKTKYVEREARIASPFSALLRREWSRLLSSSTYLLNSGMGAFFTLAAAILLLFKAEDLLALTASLPEGFGDYIPLLFVLALCMLGSSVTVTSCSVSLEGDNLWIAKSLPVHSLDILKAKLLLHLSLSQSGLLLAQLSAIFVLRPALVDALWLLLLPQLFGLVSALFGLWANLRYPKLNWMSETQAVKQSMSVLIALFGGWAMVLLPVPVAVLLVLSLPAHSTAARPVRTCFDCSDPCPLALAQNPRLPYFPQPVKNAKRPALAVGRFL